MKHTIKISFLLIAFGFFACKTIAQEVIYVKKISEKGTPMLFIPHIGCASTMWQPMAESYSKTNACYLFDFAGFAGRPALQGNYTENYVNSIVKYIETNNLKECILVGQNYGGFVAVKVAEKLPGRVKLLVLSDFYPKLSMVLGKDMTAAQLENILASIKKSVVETDSLPFANYQKQMAMGMNYMDSSFVPQFVNWQMSSDRETLAGTLVEQTGADVIPFFENNKIPTLVFSTWYFAKTYKNMPIAEAPETLGGMYPKAQNVQHAITEDAKDFIACDQPIWFAAQLNNFIKQNSGAK